MPTRVDQLRQYLSVDPNNLSLRLELCDTLLDRGQSGDALDIVRQGLERYPDDSNLLYLLAVSERRLGNYADARQALERMTQGGVQAPPVWYELGIVLMQLNEPGPAAEKLALVVQSPQYQSHFPDADMWLLRALHQSEQVDEAITHAEHVLSTDSTDARVWAALGTLYLDAGKLDAAGKLMADCTTALPEQLPVPVQAELQSVGGFVALNNGDLASSTRHFEASLQCDGLFGRSLLGLGLVRAVGGNLPAAQGLLEQTVQAMPTHIGSWHALAWIQVVQDQIDEAEASFTAAMELDRNFGDSHGGLALIAALRGDRAKAREFSKRGFRLDKQSMNVVAAELVLQHGSLKSPGLLQAALPFLQSRPGFKNSSLQDTINRFVVKKH